MVISEKAGVGGDAEPESVAGTIGVVVIVGSGSGAVVGTAVDGRGGVTGLVISGGKGGISDCGINGASLSPSIG